MLNFKNDKVVYIEKVFTLKKALNDFSLTSNVLLRWGIVRTLNNTQ